jgi:hypothetical protein
VSALTQTDSTGHGQPVVSLFKDEVPVNADSIDMAQAILKGRTRNKFPYTAEVDIVGDPSIEPGMLVDLDRYDSILDGFWIVKSVRHEMFRGSAMSYLTIVKDSNHDGSVNPTTISSPPPLFPDPVIKNNRWVATRQMMDIYS